MNEQDMLQITELDNLVSKDQLQMIKAAIPYIPANEQRFISVFVKMRELFNTVDLFSGVNAQSIGICSVGPENSSPVEMLSAMRKYGGDEEKNVIDLMLNFLQASNLYQSYLQDDDTLQAASAPQTPFGNRSTMDILKNMLNPEQQTMFDTMQMFMQTMGPNNQATN